MPAPDSTVATLLVQAIRYQLRDSSCRQMFGCSFEELSIDVARDLSQMIVAVEAGDGDAVKAQAVRISAKVAVVSSFGTAWISKVPAKAGG